MTTNTMGRDEAGKAIRKRAMEGCPLARELLILRGMCSCQGDEKSVDDAEDRYLELAVLRDAAPAAQAPRACTCHPDDRPDGPCRERYAASECQALAAQAPAASAEPVAWRWRWKDRPGMEWQISSIGPWYETENIEVQPLYAAPVATQAQPSANAHKEN